jgi:hypothetical protein
LVRASRRDGASSKENSLNSNAAREAPPYGGAVQFNRHYPPVAFLFNLLSQRMKVLS